jgi:hypothetical protein
MIGWVAVGDGISSEKVGVGGGVSVNGMGDIGDVASVVKVSGGRMMGVGVMMEGVLDGTGDKTGRGCGAMPQTSQEVRRSAHIAKLIVFLIVLL